MTGGSQRTNPWVGFLQENQQNMFTKPYFEGSGYEYPDDSLRMYETTDDDEYDYTKPVSYTYDSTVEKTVKNE